MQLKKWALVTMTATMIASVSGVHASAMTTYNQKRVVVTGSSWPRMVNNSNITRKVPKQYSFGHYPASGKLNRIRVTRGAKRVHFETAFFLPSSKGDKWSAPQSVSIVGNYAYVMYNYNRHYNDHYDFIVRFDMRKIKRHGLQLRHHSNRRLGIKVGPTFRGGHGQSLAYNPHNHQMWFLNMGTGSYVYASAERINMKTLRPNYKINFRFSSNLNFMDNTLAFDNSGHAFTYVRSGGGNTRRGAYKIYRGSISTHGVHFRLMHSTIRHAAGVIPQGLGYNHRSDRLYFVSDGSIMSIPAWKVNHLKKRDIHYIHAKTNREFEGLAFNRKGQGYLLSLRPAELLRMHGSF